MSLKAFHVFFIVVCTILALATGVWAFLDFGESGSWGTLSLGIVSLLGSVLLVRYGFWFLRKLKGEGYL